jgi:hypothetical protein
MMNRQDLEQWLGAVDSSGLEFDEVAEVLQLLLGASRRSLAIAGAEELGTLRFALAVLRDVFATDADVRDWLTRPSALLDGRSPADLLSAGRIDELADLAVGAWNQPPTIGRMQHLRSFAPSLETR